MSDVREAWRSGVEDELLFWRTVLDGGHPSYLDELRARLDPARPLDAFIASLLPTERSPEDCAVLDVAAGPVSAIGWHVDGRRPRIVAVDALGERYRLMMEERGLEPPAWTEPCDGEELTSRFAPESFDVAHIRNALDHCYAPMEVLAQMLAVLRPGGAIVVCGYIDEADHGSYDGLHQWNVRPDAGDLIVWRPGERISVASELGASIASMTVRDYSADRWMSATIRKA